MIFIVSFNKIRTQLQPRKDVLGYEGVTQLQQGVQFIPEKEKNINIFFGDTNVSVYFLCS